MRVEIILFSDPCGKKVDWDFHVLESVQRCREVEVFNVETHVLGVFRAEHAIPMQLCRCHVGGPCGELSWVINLVATGGDSDAMRVVFLQTIGDDDLCVRWRLIFWYVRYVLWFHDKNCIRSFSSCFDITLTHATEVFAKCRHPNFGRYRIIHQLAIAGDVFASEGVNHGKAIEGNVTSCVAFTKMEWDKGLWRVDRVGCDKEVNSVLADEANVAKVWKRGRIEP